MKCGFPTVKGTPCGNTLGCYHHRSQIQARRRAAINAQIQADTNYGQISLTMDEDTRALGLKMTQLWREGRLPGMSTNNPSPCGCNGEGE